jgi:hypothetical protein
VGQNPFDRDLTGFWLDPLERTEPGQMLRDRIVQADLALVPQLHQRDAGEELRDGADAVNGGGCGRRAPLYIGHAHRAAPDHILIEHDGRGETGNVAIGPLGIEPDPGQFQHLFDPRILGRFLSLHRLGHNQTQQ